MECTCLLEAYGFQIYFTMEKLKRNKEDTTKKNYVDLTVEVRLGPGLNLTMKSVPTIVDMNDLNRLVHYLEQHVRNLQQNPDEEAWVFVALDAFQLQALAGNVLSQSDGEFTLRCMVNVGRSEEGTNVYAGTEGVVSVEKIAHFTASMNSALAAWAN